MGKFYAVRNGRSQGIYTNWSDCKSQVHGYSGAQFKSFSTQSEAAAYASGGNQGGSSGSSGGYSGSARSSGSYSSSLGGSGGGGRSSQRGSYGRQAGSSSSSSGRSSNNNSGSYGGSNSGSYGGSSSGGYGGSSSSRKTSASSTRREVVYTDGSALGNGRAGAKGGWGVYWGESDPRNSSGPLKDGPHTNNRAELTAIHEAVKSIPRNKGGSYDIRADSQYASNCLGTWGDKWERNGFVTANGDDVKNRDLIEPIRENLSSLRKSGVDVQFSYVEGHAGHEGNEAADRLARKGAAS